VKLVGKAGEQLQIELAPWEKDLLGQLLRLYPRIPSGHQRLSKTRETEQSSQRLLEESLAEVRAQSKRSLQLLLGDSKRWKKSEENWELTLTGSEVEWLLKVLNDVRVGSWIELGSPELPFQVMNADTAANVWIMEMAGSFQMDLLEILEG
jgi:hypothetical protein